MLLLLDVAGVGALGPAACFAACERCLHLIVNVFMLVELQLKRHLAQEREAVVPAQPRVLLSASGADSRTNKEGNTPTSLGEGYGRGSGRLR